VLFILVVITSQMLYITTNIQTQILMIDYDLYTRQN